MKIIIILLLQTLSFAICAQDCVGPGQARIDLDVNNVKAGLLNCGDFWWDGTSGRYIVPNDDPDLVDVSAIFCGGLWLSGSSESSNWKLATQTYRQEKRTDYYSGPLDPSGQPIPGGCSNWDNFWKVDRSQIDAHRSDYEADGTINFERDQIFGWPAKGNSAFEGIYGFQLPPNQDLAPFIDLNLNGSYEPLLGDYPHIKGDQAIWWVFNDVAGPHNLSQGDAVGAEVQVLAYAWSDEGSTALHNTTFYDFTYIYKAQEKLNDAYFSLWLDIDLGCKYDDNIGYDTTYQMLYVYNEDVIDGSDSIFCANGVNTYEDKVPMLAIKKLNTQEYPVTSLTAFNAGSLEPPPFEPVPVTLSRWHLIRGLQEDGSPYVAEGDGSVFGSTNHTKFMFTGDPSDEEGWSMCTVDIPHSDMRVNMSSSLGTLSSGQVTKHSYAVVFVEDVPHPCPSLDMLREAVDAACEAILTSTDELDRQELSISVTPNPTNDLVTIAAGALISSITITSLAGQEVRSLSELHSREVVVSLSDMPVGMYTLTIVTDTGSVATRRVVVTK